MILISACLAGINCKYDGSNNLNQKVINLLKTEQAVLVCPEQLGGLPTPRYPSEIKGSKVYDQNGKDVSLNFKKGAFETLRIAQLCGCKKAVLKQRSPSCGKEWIYDGLHREKLIRGEGITAHLLKKHGIKIISEEDL